MNYNFIVPVVYNQEDNSSYIGKQTILIKDCSIFGTPKGECDGYNFNKCPNDDTYCQPFIPGDILYFQFLIDTTFYDAQSFELINTSTGLPIVGLVFSTVEGVVDSTKYFTIQINTTSLQQKCVYLKLTLEKAEGGDNDFITGEPFCAVRCEEPTLLIEGEYLKYDCNKNYYGIATGSINGMAPYKASFRVRGVVEPNGFSIEKTDNGVNPVKSKQTERFILFTEKVPYYVAKQIEVCFNSKQLTIQGIDYKGQVKLDKNFEEGSEWIIKEDIFIDCPEINFGCDN